MNINTEIFKVFTTLDISYSLDVDDVSMQGGESPASGPQQCSCYVRTIKLEIDHDIHFDVDVKNHQIRNRP